MKKNTGAKIFIWIIIILMGLALTIPFLIGIIGPLVNPTPEPEPIDIQTLIDQGKVTIETATPEPATTDIEGAENTAETEGAVDTDATLQTEETLENNEAAANQAPTEELLPQ